MRAFLVTSPHTLHIFLRRYRRLLSYFDPNIKNPDLEFKPPALLHKIPIIGFSATFSRHDGLALGSVFERIVYHRDFLEMIKEHWYAISLCKCSFCVQGWCTGFLMSALHLFVQTSTCKTSRSTLGQEISIPPAWHTLSTPLV